MRPPVTPYRREEIVLTRHEVYDIDAVRLVLAGPSITSAERSPLRFYWGAATADPAIRVLVILDPGDAVIRGLSLAEGRAFDLTASKAPGGGFEIRDADASAAESGSGPGWGCGQETLPGAIPVAAPSLEGRSTDHLGSLHSVTVAVDTDTELLSLKFANDTTAATNYVASLFAAMNAMYEADLNVSPRRRDLSAGRDRPVAVVSGGNANVSQFNEFSNYWAANCGGVTRGLAAMLSGKQPSSNSASGIAWINGLCSTSYGYSFTQVFRVDYLAGDARVVGP